MSKPRITNWRRLVLASLAFSFAGGPGLAAEMAWQGTLTTELGPYELLHVVGSGVATVTTDASGLQLRNLLLAGGITGVDAVPITDPDVTATFKSVVISPRLGTGTLGPFWPITPTGPQLVQNALPVRGQARLCLLSAGCAFAQVFPFSEHTGQEAVGVGGLLTAGGFGSIRVSMLAAPWTVYTASQVIRTIHNGTAVRYRTGWIHGPASFSSDAAVTGAALQLVTPLEITGNNGLYLPGFAYLTLKFIPEPGFPLLLGTGILGLIVLGRSRVRP
jgi:hypothetical protein